LCEYGGVFGCIKILNNFNEERKKNMLQFLLRRFSQSILLVIAMAIVVFFGVYALGNPIDLLVNPEAPTAEYDAAVKRLGLDLPLYEQFFRFLSNAIQGDFGNSFIHGTSATELIFQKMPATFELAFSVIIMAVVVGVPLGMIAGFNHDNAIGRTIMSGSIFGFSLPNFWIGMLLILLFAVKLGWLPSIGRGDTVEIFGIPFSFLTLDGLKHMILPVMTMALYKMSIIIRLTRAGVMEVMEQDYIKYAYAKGLKKNRIIFVHVLKNILIPVVTVVGLEFGNVLAFAVVTESVFSWPGMGKLLIDSILLMDRPVVVAYLMIVVVIFIVINLIVDILYAALDPRIRLTTK